MDAIIARIKGYVLIINPGIIDPVYDDENFLNFCVEDVVYRAVAYMNRDQLIAAYEEDDTQEPPIPRVVERALATAVIGVFNNTEALKELEQSVSSASDNGQSVSFRNEIANFLSSSDDAKIFSGCLALLKQYRLASVIRNC